MGLELAVEYSTRNSRNTSNCRRSWINESVNEGKKLQTNFWPRETPNANIFVGLIPGHFEVNYSRYKSERTHNTDFRFWTLEDETFRDILFDCNALVNKRRLTLEMDYIEWRVSGADPKSGKGYSDRTWNRGGWEKNHPGHSIASQLEKNLIYSNCNLGSSIDGIIYKFAVISFVHVIQWNYGICFKKNVGQTWQMKFIDFSHQFSSNNC